MSDEDKLFALTMAVLSNSNHTSGKPIDCATRAIQVAQETLKQLKELNDTNH